MPELELDSILNSKIMVALSTFPISVRPFPVVIITLISHLSTQAQLLPLPDSLSTDHCSAYTSVFCFGDSLSDTGNLLYSEANASAGRLPYGQTFFHRPTGRSSDGRLIIDFLGMWSAHLSLHLHISNVNSDPISDGSDLYIYICVRARA